MPFRDKRFRWASAATVVVVAAGLGVVAVGCKGGTDRSFADALKKVQAGEADTIDARKIPGFGDEQMRRLAAAPGTEKLRALVLDGSAVSDEGVKALPWLAGLTTFSASKCRVTDAGVAHLPQVANLETLRLDQARVTDLGLEAVGKMRSLRELSLWRCAVTDRGLAHLKSLPHLTKLSLDETGVTGAGVREHLGDMTSLRHLKVWRTKVTAADAEALKQKNPGLKVGR